jgi:hypothetical protein
MRRGILGLLAGVGLFAVLNGAAPAQEPPLPRFYYYPYYYYMHSYWPSNSAPWPEAPGQPYMRPPAYMAYPPFLENRWRYDLWGGMRFYQGNHFWLDQF